MPRAKKRIRGMARQNSGFDKPRMLDMFDKDHARQTRLRAYAIMHRLGLSIDFRYQPEHNCIINCCLCGGVIDFAAITCDDAIHVECVGGVDFSCHTCTKGSGLGLSPKERMARKTQAGRWLQRLAGHHGADPQPDAVAPVPGEEGRDCPPARERGDAGGEAA